MPIRCNSEMGCTRNSNHSNSSEMGLTLLSFFLLQADEGLLRSKKGGRAFPVYKRSPGYVYSQPGQLDFRLCAGYF